MSFGRSIRIYLADGTPSGIRHVEIVNWSGQAIYCPRSRFAELSKWEETKRPGVYFLFERQSNDSESPLPRADRDTMEEFIVNMKIVLGTLGHKLLEPLKELSKIDQQSNKSTIAGIPLTFSLKNLKAYGQVTDDGFLLLAGSDVSLSATQSLAAGWRAIREKWLEDGLLKVAGDNYRLEKET